MARYHINPETQRPNICTATKEPCKYAVDGKEPEHYATKEEAKAAIAAKAAAENDTFTTVSKKSSQGSGVTPVSRERARAVDEQLQELYNKQVKHMVRVKSLERLAKDLEDRVRFNPGADESLVSRIAEVRREAGEEKAKMDALGKDMEPLNREFQESGGWNRAFLVTNKNGHVHRSMECSTTRATTEFEWLPAYSGADEEEIVDAAGEKACTECYPTAPVGTLSKPFSMDRGKEKYKFTPSGDNVTGEDGKALKVTRGLPGNFTETIKTEKQAYSKVIETITNRARDKHNFGDPGKVSPDSYQEYLERDDRMEERENDLLEALARNHQVSRDQVRNSLVEQAQEKLNRQRSHLVIK